jgi:hypothetical protein
VNYVIFCWSMNHIYARAAIPNSASIYLYLQLCYMLLVSCLDAREGSFEEVSMPSLSLDVINVCP